MWKSVLTQDLRWPQKNLRGQFNASTVSGETSCKGQSGVELNVFKTISNHLLPPSRQETAASVLVSTLVTCRTVEALIGRPPFIVRRILLSFSALQQPSSLCASHCGCCLSWTVDVSLFKTLFSHLLWSEAGFGIFTVALSARVTHHNSESGDLWVPLQATVNSQVIELLLCCVW